jgi:hypothetical protein
MADVIDKLVFSLGLDSSDLRKNAELAKRGLRETGAEAEKTGKSFTEMGHDGSGAFLSINKSAGIFFATLAGATALRAFVKNTADATASIGRFSANMGMSVTDVSAWAIAGEKVGGTADSMRNAFALLSKARFDLQTTGQSNLMAPLSKLGINSIDSDPAKMILRISDAMQKLKAESSYKYNFLKNMGLDEGAVNLIMQGPAAMQRSVAASRRMAITQDEVKAAEDLQKNVKEIDKSFTKLANQTLPGINSLLKSFVSLNDATGGLVVNATAAVVAFKALGGTSIVSLLSKVANGMGGVSGFLGKFGGGAGMMLHSGELNTGESGFLAKLRAEQKKATQSNSGGNFSALEKKYGLPAGLLDSMWLQESGRGKNMMSSAGATGHFQFMPKTAAAYGMSKADTYDLVKSSEAAAKMMSQLLKHYGGNSTRALAAYNFGMGNVDSGKAWPTETQNYGRQILSRLGPSAAAGNVNNSRSVQNHIGEVKVYTQATDAAGIAKDMNKGMNYALAGQADYGVTP